MKAMIVVDVQNDFCPGGALAVPEGDQVVPVINSLMDTMDLGVACQDWHPASHGSFAINHEGHQPGEVIDLNGLEQVLWPTHCVQGTGGAAFRSDLNQGPIEVVIRKGTDAGIDSSGAFCDNGSRKATGLEGLLKELGVTRLFVAGLALDYCVKFTALDAARLGFETRVVLDACRAVQAEDAAIAELETAGVGMLKSTDV